MDVNVITTLGTFGPKVNEFEVRANVRKRGQRCSS